MGQEGRSKEELHSLHKITSRILKALDEETDRLKVHRYNREHKEEYIRSIIDLPRHTIPQVLAIQDKIIEDTIAKNVFADDTKHI